MTNANWYALRSKPQKEDAVWRQLQVKEVEVFYPRLRVNPVNPRAKKIKPYFPGYMFVKLNLEEVGVSAFQWMPHALGLVSFGGEPSAVPDNLIHAIRTKVQAIADAGGEKLNGLKPGDLVRVQEGPFAGYEAIFNERLPGTERVRVLLEFLNRRQVTVELSVAQIESVQKKPLYQKSLAQKSLAQKSLAPRE
jgi:transcriptional antiterminator RfaH